MLFTNTLSNKADKYDLKLSSNIIRFQTPSKYSKDFPKPITSSKTINIFDKDIYNDSGTAVTLQDFYFDYGKGFIFGGVNGTLKATVLVRKTNFETIENDKNEQLIKILTHDFNSDFSEQDLKDFNIQPPKSINIIQISDITWAHYKYSTNDQLILIYATPLSDQHYLQILFKFIDNTPGEKNNWKEQANEQLKDIMESFSIDSSGN